MDFVHGLFSKQNTVFEKLDLFLSGHKFCQKELIPIAGLVSVRLQVLHDG